jgi:Tol biopolymer transport system component
MSHLKILSALLVIVALAVPATAAAAPGGGSVVFSKTTKVGDEDKGGLYAVRDGRLNQLTENPTDSEPNFSPDGRTIAFVRDGDIYSVRPDGSGERHLSSGPEIDSAPLVSPNGKYVVFERRSLLGGPSGPADLYTVGAMGGGLRPLASSGNDDHDAAFAADGKAIVFVRGSADSVGGVNDDLYSVRPNGSGVDQLTTTAKIDEFEPRYFAGGIIFSRGESSPGPAAYADIYTMKRNGSKVRSQVAGVGSAYVEDVSPDGRLVLFRRDQGLWGKRIGNAKARRLSALPDGSQTSAVFSSDGKRVAAFVAIENEQSLVSIAVANGRQTRLADAANYGDEDGTTIGPVIDWQPVR